MLCKFQNKMIREKLKILETDLERKTYGVVGCEVEAMVKIIESGLLQPT